MNGPSLLNFLIRTVNVVGHQVHLSTLRIQGAQIKKSSVIGNLLTTSPQRLSIGENCHLENNVFIKINHPYAFGLAVEIGDNVFVGYGSHLNCETHISIGRNCLIAASVTIADVGHQTNLGLPMRMQPSTSAPIMIKENVWIGTGAIILAGVTLCEGSVIGAGSVVTKNVGINEIWTGAPARFRRMRV